MHLCKEEKKIHLSHWSILLPLSHVWLLLDNKTRSARPATVTHPLVVLSPTPASTSELICRINYSRRHPPGKRHSETDAVNRRSHKGRARAVASRVDNLSHLVSTATAFYELCEFQASILIWFVRRGQCSRSTGTRRLQKTEKTQICLIFISRDKKRGAVSPTFVPRSSRWRRRLYETSRDPWKLSHPGLPCCKSHSSPRDTRTLAGRQRRSDTL